MDNGIGPGPPLLTPKLLSALEARWTACGWVGLSNLRPGLSAPQQDSGIKPLGLRLPLEARLWWSWHDGAEANSQTGWRAFGGPGMAYLTLQDAVATFHRQRATAVSLAEDETNGETQDSWWNPNWLPILETIDGRVIACDCSVEPGEPTPIRSVRWDVDSEFFFQTPRAGSLGQVVTWWIQAIDHGGWQYRPDAEQWVRVDDLLGVERELTRLF